MKLPTHKEAIGLMCKGCIYDPCSLGTWRQQVTLCSVKTCPLWHLRPKTDSAIPESVLRWYGVKLAEFEALESISEED
jgi:hypothetical protein